MILATQKLLVTIELCSVAVGDTGRLLSRLFYYLVSSTYVLPARATSTNVLLLQHC
jgi:hypothetical protein